MNLDWFLNPIKNHYADFEGRASLQEFWMFILYWLLISVGLFILSFVIGGLAKLVHSLIALAIFVPSLAIGARRLHDTSKSGWWQLLSVIPFIGIIILIVLFAQKGEAGANQYGSPVSADDINKNAGVPTAESKSPHTSEEDPSN